MQIMCPSSIYENRKNVLGKYHEHDYPEYHEDGGGYLIDIKNPYSDHFEITYLDSKTGEIETCHADDETAASFEIFDSQRKKPLSPLELKWYQLRFFVGETWCSIKYEIEWHLYRKHKYRK